mmetsp:Transcript_11779/g.21255  ORF Transcript_11779/g.21255 Transcript_11779/m.21255 type:complete len:243 (-) Transcript_11779:1840-2568(-)
MTNKLCESVFDFNLVSGVSSAEQGGGVVPIICWSSHVVSSYRPFGSVTAESVVVEHGRYRGRAPPSRLLLGRFHLSFPPRIVLLNIINILRKKAIAQCIRALHLHHLRNILRRWPAPDVWPYHVPYQFYQTLAPAPEQLGTVRPTPNLVPPIPFPRQRPIRSCCQFVQRQSQTEDVRSGVLRDARSKEFIGHVNSVSLLAIVLRSNIACQPKVSDLTYGTAPLGVEDKEDVGRLDVVMYHIV